MRQLNLYDVIWETRRLFQTMAEQSNDMLRPLGINASMRAVLEFLDRKEPQTVPQIAKTKDVSRQHIQNIVNELQQKGLIEIIDNPAHKRSSLIQRTPQGRECFANLKQREKQLLAAMAQSFDEQALATTAQTLKSLRVYLHSEAWQKMLTEP